MQKAESQTRALFRWWKEQVKQHRLKEPDKSKYEIYNAVKNEIGKSKNWQQLQERLAEKVLLSCSSIRADGRDTGRFPFQRRIHVQGFEIDRNFSFSKTG